MEKKIVSQFEYAIMQEAAKLNAEVKADLEITRPITDAEVIQQRKAKELDFLSKIVCRTQSHRSELLKQLDSNPTGGVVKK
jgi:hypothetical protein